MPKKQKVRSVTRHSWVAFLEAPNNAEEVRDVVNSHSTVKSVLRDILNECEEKAERNPCERELLAHQGRVEMTQLLSLNAKIDALAVEQIARWARGFRVDCVRDSYLTLSLAQAVKTEHQSDLREREHTAEGVWNDPLRFWMTMASVLSEGFLAETLTLIGAIWYAQGKNHQAADMFRLALENDPLNERALLFSGCLFTGVPSSTVSQLCTP